MPYADSERVVATRNPYYWKVDPDGNQLPYIDGITWAKLDDPQLMALKMTSGEFDFAFRHINNSTFKSVLFDGQETGNYRFVDVKDLPANDAVILLNLNSTDDDEAEDLPEQGFPHRAQPRDQPSGDHRSRLCRAGRSGAGGAAARA